MVEEGVVPIEEEEEAETGGEEEEAVGIERSTTQHSPIRVIKIPQTLPNLSVFVWLIVISPISAVIFSDVSFASFSL